jgi:hypothetical protein
MMWTHARRSDVAAVDRVIALLEAAGIPPDERHEKARAWASGETPRRLEDGSSADAAPTVESGVEVAAVPAEEPTVEPTVVPAVEPTGTTADETSVPRAEAPEPGSDERG